MGNLVLISTSGRYADSMVYDCNMTLWAKFMNQLLLENRKVTMHSYVENVYFDCIVIDIAHL